MINVKMLSIPETSQKFEGLSQYTIRQAIKKGYLPAVRIGKKYLLNEQVVENFLKGECAAIHVDNNAYEIKPINVK